MEVFAIFGMIFGLTGLLVGGIWLVLYIAENYPEFLRETFLGIVKPLKGHKIIERWREQRGTKTEYWFKCECGNERYGNLFTVNLEYIEHKDMARDQEIRYAEETVKKKGWLG